MNPSNPIALSFPSSFSSTTLGDLEGKGFEFFPTILSSQRGFLVSSPVIGERLFHLYVAIIVLQIGRLHLLQ